MMNVRDKVTARLTETAASELAKHPVVYGTGFTLLPGKYTIKFLARDAETGRIGTYQTAFVIRNLNNEEKRLPISSVVLSSQHEELKDSLYNARQKDDGEATNPLVQDGRKLIPSVTREFVFLCFAGLQGMLLNLLPPKWYRRVSFYIQMAAVLVLVLCFFLEFVLVSFISHITSFLLLPSSYHPKSSANR
jgi:hypothetical protein